MRNSVYLLELHVETDLIGSGCTQKSLLVGGRGFLFVGGLRAMGVFGREDVGLGGWRAVQDELLPEERMVFKTIPFGKLHVHHTAI